MTRTVRAQPRLAALESEFQALVLDLAQLQGWRAMHVRRSRVRADRVATATSVAGWPDLVLWHPTRRLIIARELKSNAGRLTVEQRQVLDELAACGVDVAVWRPRDWPDIQRTLVTARRLT